jgi:hypothetical protein
MRHGKTVQSFSEIKHLPGGRMQETAIVEQPHAGICRRSERPGHDSLGLASQGLARSLAVRPRLLNRLRKLPARRVAWGQIALPGRLPALLGCEVQNHR